METVAVIGGGASGITAALFAAGRGARVILFEKQNKLGRKILVTGNGRCNISNTGLGADRYHGSGAAFLHSVFARFGLDQTVEFFRSIGIPFVEGRDGRLYPASLQASTVVRMLEYQLEKNKVEVHLHRRIESVETRGTGFRLVTGGRDECMADRVILAAGSSAYPQVGGSEWGYELARSMGHGIVNPFPAILPLSIPLKRLHRLEGIKWDCQVTVRDRGKTVAESTDELLFTKYGISGPAALDVSRAVNEAVIKGREPRVMVDFFPGHTRDELDSLLDDVMADGNRPIAFALLGILKERVPEFILDVMQIETDRRCGDISTVERELLTGTLKGLELAPGKPRSFSEAVVAAGGVDAREIDPKTMESRITKGFYMTGELLDVDGDSGGFNLQFAWSSGAIAGLAAAR